MIKEIVHKIEATKRSKQAMITLRRMEEHRFSIVYYLQHFTLLWYLLSCVKVKLICVPSDKKDDFTLLIRSIIKWDLTLLYASSVKKTKLKTTHLLYLQNS